MKDYEENNNSNNKNLLDVLEDLEGQLRHDSDKKTRREFYSLGGWSLVASLVSPSVHHTAAHDDDDSGTSNNNNNQNDNELEEYILTIRAAAVSVLGVVVQNAPEFQSWVLNEIQLQDTTTSASTTTSTSTTPLELVVQALVEVSSAASSPDSCSASTLDSQQELAREAVHTLSIFLRNHEAQLAFSNNMSHDANTLGHQAAEWALEASTRIHHAASAVAATATTPSTTTSSTNVPMSRHALKMTLLLLSLANDIINDFQNAPPEQNYNNNYDNEQDDNIVVNVFSTSDWCQAAIQAATLSPSSNFQQLVFLPLQEMGLRTVATLSRTPTCFTYYRDNDHGKAGMADLTLIMNQLQVQATTNKRNLLRTQKQDKDQQHLLLVLEALDSIAASSSTSTTTSQ